MPVVTTVAPKQRMCTLQVYAPPRNPAGSGTPLRRPAENGVTTERINAGGEGPRTLIVGGGIACPDVICILVVVPGQVATGKQVVVAMGPVLVGEGATTMPPDRTGTGTALSPGRVRRFSGIPKLAALRRISPPGESATLP